MMHDKTGLPVLMLRFGESVDFRFARVVDLLTQDLMTFDEGRAIREQTKDLITYEAAKAQWLKAPLTYDETAMLVGCPRRFLVRKVNEGVIPCLDFDGRKAFRGHHVEEIQQLFERGEIRYARKGSQPWGPRP